MSGLSRTSPQVETQTTKFRISEHPLPIDHTFTKSATEILLPEVDSSPVEKLLDSAEKFEIKVPISEIPLPKSTPEVIETSDSPQLNSIHPQLNFSISEISLPLDDSCVGKFDENSKTLSSAVSRENSAENSEMNFPISEIPLPLDPICESSEELNKLLIAESDVFVPSNTPTDQTRTELKLTFLQESILNIPKELIDSEKIISEFSKKCRIGGDYLRSEKASVSEDCISTENLDLNVNNRDTQSSLPKTRHQLRTEKTSMNKNKSDNLSINSNSVKDEQKFPNICQQESSISFDSKSATFQPKLQEYLKSIKQAMSSKSTIVETEFNPRQETENKRPTQVKNISTSHNADKESDMRKKSIFDDIKKDSDIPTDWSNEKINNLKLEIDGKTKLHMTKLENKGMKASESESGSNRSLVLPKVDIKSDKIIPKTLPIDSKVKADRIILKPISRKKKASPSQLRIASSENKTDVALNSASTKTEIDIPSNSASTKSKINIPNIQITECDKPILPNAARAESRLKADISPKGAKSRVAFLKPNTRKGMERIFPKTASL